MKRASLAEVMGKAGAERQGKLTLDHLPELLGEAMPDLPRNAVGRYRLIRSLKARLGPNYRALPGVSDIVREFDSAVDVERRIAQVRQIKYSPGGKR